MTHDQRVIGDIQSHTVKVSVIERELALKCLVGSREDPEVGVGLASDVLSQILARASRGCILVTTQHSANLIAVASHTKIADIIITSGYRPGAEALGKAQEEGIGLYTTPLETFDVVGSLYRLGIKGRQPL